MNAPINLLDTMLAAQAQTLKEYKPVLDKVCICGRKHFEFGRLCASCQQLERRGVL